MRKGMKMLSLIGIGLFAGRWVCDAQAKGVGSSAGQFLNLIGSAKAMSMGGAGTALGNDLHGLQSNAASISGMQNPKTLLSQGLLYQDMKFSYGAYAQPTRYGVPVMEYMNVSYGDYESTNLNRMETGSQSPSSRMFGLGWSTTGSSILGNRLRLGVIARYLQSYMGNASASGSTFSIGGIYNTRFNGVTVGASVNHLGSGLKYSGESSPLPRNFRLGLSYLGQEFRTINAKTSYCLDAVAPNDGTVHVLAGAEFNLYDLVSFQIGYVGAENIQNRLRYGIGIGVQALQLSYAVSADNSLGASHRLTIDVGFGKGIWNIGQIFGAERLVKRDTLNAYHYLKKGNTGKAALFAKRVLKRRPNNEAAVGIIEEIERKNLVSMASDIYYEALKSYHAKQFTDAHDKMNQVRTLDPDNREYNKLYEKVETAYTAQLKQEALELVAVALTQMESEFKNYQYLNLPQEEEFMQAAQSAHELITNGDYESANRSISNGNKIINEMVLALQDRARERERLIAEERRKYSLNQIQGTIVKGPEPDKTQTPDKVDLEYYEQAKEHRQNGRHDEAIRLLREVNAKNKSYAAGKEALRNSLKSRGIVHFRAHAYKKALRDFEESYKLEPTDVVLRKWISDLKASPVLTDAGSKNE